jgi:hypothetical protein
MDLARILNQGVGSWLHFEYSCNRSGLFNEKYLSYPIGQLLSARYGNRVLAEFLHPILAPMMTGPGRRPQVDFAYCDPYPTVKVAVETKWIGRRKVSIEEIVWDLIRLELISANSNAECFFMIGGRRKSLESLFTSEKFSGPNSAPDQRPILDWTNNEMKSFWLTPRYSYRIPLLRNVFKGTPDIEYPQRIITRRTEPFPKDCKMQGFQVYSWKIAAAEKRQTFRAKQARHYR